MNGALLHVDLPPLQLLRRLSHKLLSTGLRVSEIMALKWGDFEALTLLVQRAIVHGRVDEVKTEYSRDHVPLDVGLAQLLLSWRMTTAFPQDDDWVFANLSTGKPYHQEEIQKRHIKSAARKAGLDSAIGWHTFRHTYRSCLDETGAPMKVQQELMRHASIQTTMNVYGRVMTETKRQANSRVVNIVLGRPKPAPSIKIDCWSGAESWQIPYVIERNGRHEETRTPDLYRVQYFVLGIGGSNHRCRLPHSIHFMKSGVFPDGPITYRWSRKKCQSPCLISALRIFCRALGLTNLLPPVLKEAKLCPAAATSTSSLMLSACENCQSLVLISLVWLAGLGGLVPEPGKTMKVTG